MKKVIPIIISLMFAIHHSQADVDVNYLKYIEKLIIDKQYQKAFDEHKFFFDESKKIPRLGAVRLSFGLSSWAELGKAYPPAHDALVMLSDERKALLLNGEKSFDVFHEYAAINRYIDKKLETIDTFLAIDKKFPENTDRFFIIMDDLLIEEKRYDVVKKFLKDPIYQYENSRHRRESELSQLRKGSRVFNIDDINSRFEAEIKKLIDTTTKIGMQEEAEEIQGRFDAYFIGNLKRKFY